MTVAMEVVEAREEVAMAGVEAREQVEMVWVKAILELFYRRRCRC